MSCRYNSNRLVGFLLGELPRWRMLRIAAHVGRCPECLHELFSLQDVVTGLSNLGKVPAPEGALERAKQRALARQTARPQPVRRPFPALAAAGALVVTIALALVIPLGHPPAPTPQPTVLVAPSRQVAAAPPTPAAPSPPAAVSPKPTVTPAPAPPQKRVALIPRAPAVPRQAPAKTPEAHPERTALATVWMVYGQPQIRRRGNKWWQPLKADDEIRAGDHLRTDLVSRVILALPRAQKMCLSFDSRAEVAEAGPSGPQSVRLARGAFWARLRRGHQPFEVRTGAGTIKALGTEFAVESPKPTVATVTVITGEAELINRHGIMRCARGARASMAVGKAPTVIGDGGHIDLIRYRTAWGTDMYSVATPRKLLLDGLLAKLVAPRAAIGIDGDKGDGGLLVTMVLPSSPAAEAGIRPGDLLKDLAGEPIRDRADLLTVLGRLRPGETAAAVIQRDGSQHHRSLRTAAVPYMPPAEQDLSRLYRLVAAGTLKEAEALARNMVRDQPRSAAAHNNLGAIREFQGDLREAVQLYQRACDLSPGAAWYHYNLGTALRQAGNLDRSAEELRLAVKLAPEWGEARFALGEVYVFAHRYAEAVEEARKLREVQGSSAWGDSVRGYALISQERFDAAIAVLKAATERDPFCWEAFRLLGNAYVSKGDAESAAKALSRAKVLRVSDPRVHNSLGLAAWRAGDYNRAGELIRAAIRMDPTCGAFYQNLGLVYHDAKQYSRAREAFERAIALQPEAPYAYQGLGITYVAAGEYELASDAYVRQLAVDPGSTTAFKAAVAAYGYAWSLQGAVALQEEATAQEVSAPEVWAKLAELFDAHGATQLAQECRAQARAG